MYDIFFKMAASMAAEILIQMYLSFPFRYKNQCSICWGLGVQPPSPSGASQPPSFRWSPIGLVKKRQKYIADPLLVLPQIEY